MISRGVVVVRIHAFRTSTRLESKPWRTSQRQRWYVSSIPTQNPLCCQVWCDKGFLAWNTIDVSVIEWYSLDHRLQYLQSHKHGVWKDLVFLKFKSGNYVCCAPGNDFHRFR